MARSLGDFPNCRKILRVQGELVSSLLPRSLNLIALHVHATNLKTL